MQPFAAKVWSDKARQSAAIVRKGGTALGSVQMGGTTVSPAIAARVKQILAAQASKGKKKGGDKAKPKASAKQKAADKAKKLAEHTAKLAAAKEARDKAKAERVAASNAKKQASAQARVAKQQAAAKQKAGSAKQKMQALKQKAQERAKAQAARKQQQDAKAKERAGAAQAKQQAAQQRKARVLAEKVKRGEKLSASDQVDAEDAGLIKAGKAMSYLLTELSDHTTATNVAIKAGARHSRTDQQHIQAIHDSAVACGADCGSGDEADQEMDMEAGKAIKSIIDDPGYYAQHECGDIMQAANALSTLCMLMQSELAEEDEDTTHVMMLCDACRTLVQFIDAELDECEQAAKDDAEEDATVGHEPMKAIAMREDVNPKAGIAEYGKVEFADAKNKKYPIDTEDHIRAAWNYISKEANAAKYDPDEVNQIKAKIVAAWKKKIDKAGPPSAGKALDNAWLHIDGDAIKALDNDVIRGYAVRFGDSDHPDLQRDYYTKATDFWLDHFGWPRPITYHHGMDAQTRNDPVIGHWLKAGIDDVGVWMEGQIDRAHAYYKAMKELAQRGYLRLSSDSAPQWVIREKQQNGVSEIKRWPLVTSSVTVTPMEPRMLPVEVKAYLAEIGLDIDTDAQAVNTASASADGPQADDERARAILLELDLLEIELETTL